MQTSFITSYLTFYLKAKIGLEGSMVKVSNPNTILKLIPLGSSNKTIPINQISSLDDSFKMDIKSFLWGIIFTGFGFNSLGTNFIVGLIIVLYGILTVLSSFQTYLNIYMTSGQSYHLSVVIFEKSKLLTCKETIENIIQKRYEDTNVAVHTEKQTNAIVDALSKK